TLELLRSKRPSWDVVAVATVEEEFRVVCLGARTAAENLSPDLGIAIDVSHGDMPGAREGETVPLGSGPALAIGGNIHPAILEARIDPSSARGKRGRGPHVMLCAHMDEVGLMVFGIEKEGRLRFRRVGGIDPRILPGQVFRVGPDGIRGVVGALPPHLTPRNERDRVTAADDLYLDIGARSREEAEERVPIGTYAVFDTTYEAWGTTRKGKDFDDRAGCAVLASLIQRRPPVPVTSVWSVQEEVGLRGAAAAARRVQPDLAIVLEGTASGEAPGASPDEQSPCMGKGPALT